MMRRRLGATRILLLLLVAGCATAEREPPPGPGCSLDVLLSNDDGWDAPGIRAVRSALLDAGHRVTLVAPLEQQSGRGGAINTRVGSAVAVVEQAPGVWSVDGTPTDSVRAALDVILADDPPDLVVAGANFGANLGREGVHSSGTLGATLAAHYDGIPAIAISTGIVIEERDATPPFRSTFAGFDTSAAFVVRLIDLLTQRHGCEAVMPDGVALNVNVPVPVESIQGVRYAPLSTRNVFRMHWQRDGDGRVRVGFRATDPSARRPGDDADLYSQGFVTITPIDGDVTLTGGASRAGLPARPPALLPARTAP